MTRGSLTRLLRSLKSLARNDRGNVLILTAMGMPIMLGGAGFGVDTAQWYLWKRELQTAVDAAALSGAYTYAQSPAYDFRASAQRELARNVDVVTVNATPASLENWNAGTNNAITVTATTQRALPFSAMLGVSPPLIRAMATAAIIPDGKHCMVSLDKEAESAIDVEGNALVDLDCGISSNSRHARAITFDGSAEVKASPISAVGGIVASDGILEEDSTIRPYSAGQKDPFAGITFSDPVGIQEVPFDRPTGKDKNEATEFASGIHKGDVALQDNINFAPGVHIFDGGVVSINSQAIVTGTGVLIVLRNGASLQLNGGSKINLSAATSAGNGVPSDLVGVLIYQEPSTAGTTIKTSTINGNAEMHLGGAIYTPKQDFQISGNSSPSTNCLLLVARRITVTGSAEINNTCTGTPPYAADTTVEVVRLVR